MASLLNTQINNTYPGLIKLDDNLPLDGNPKALTDGNGNALPIQVSNISVDFYQNVDFTNAVVTGLPGGAAGLVNGTGSDSLKSSDALTTNPSVAPTQGSIILGDGATLADNPSRPTWGALGHIGIGKNINITENSFSNVYSKSVIAIGQNAQVDPYYDGGNIAIGHDANSTNMHGISIGANSQAWRFAAAIGQYAQATAESTFALGRFANASTLNAIAIGASTNSTGTNSVAIGQGATAESDTAVSIGDGNTNQNGPNMSIGRGNNNYANGSNIFGQNNTMGLGNGGCQLLASNINVPAGINDFVGIGRISNPSGNINNSIQIGLVSSMTNAQNSVCIGRGSSLNGADNSVAIGRDASCTTGQSAAVGYNVTATRSNFVTVNELELKTVGGGIIMPSPNGTLYKITVSDTGDLVVSAA